MANILKGMYSMQDASMQDARVYNSDYKDLPPLYLLDNLGSIRIWKVRVEDNRVIKTFGVLESVTGVEGKLRDSITISSPKNTGKSNSITSHEQAIKEAKALWKKQQKRKGYVLSPEKAHTATIFKPMLAYDWFSEQGQNKFYKYRTKYVFWSFKLDGVRMYYKNGKKYSRNHDEYPIVNDNLEERLEMVVSQFKRMFPDFDDVILDGELYIHGKTLGEIQSAVKTKNKNSEILTYNIFDFYSDKNRKVCFFNRYAMLLEVMDYFIDDSYVLPVFNYIMNDGTFDAYDVIRQVEDKGYEGIMIRLDRPYEQKRSPCLFKGKKFKDNEFMLVDVIPIQSYYDGEKLIPQGKAVILLDNKTRKLQEVSFEGSVVEKEDFLLHKERYIGKMLKVKYKQVLDSGMLEFPVAECVRVCS